jgi:hypothetical protein
MFFLTNNGYTQKIISDADIQMSIEIADRLIDANDRLNKFDFILGREEYHYFYKEVEVTASVSSKITQIFDEFWSTEKIRQFYHKFVKYDEAFRTEVYCNNNMPKEMMLEVGSKTPKFSKFFSSLLGTVEEKNRFGAIYKPIPLMQKRYIVVSNLPHFLVGISAFAPTHKNNLTDIGINTNSALDLEWEGAGGSSCQSVFFDDYSQIEHLPSVSRIENMFVTVLTDTTDIVTLFDARVLSYLLDGFFFTQKIYADNGVRAVFKEILKSEKIFYIPADYNGYESMGYEWFNYQQDRHIPSLEEDGEWVRCLECNGTGYTSHWNEEYQEWDREECECCNGEGGHFQDREIYPYNDYGYNDPRYPFFDRYGASFKVAKRYTDYLKIAK